MNGTILQPPELSMASILLFLIAVGIFGIMVVALEMAIAMRSRSVKEAGSILGPMMLFFFTCYFHNSLILKVLNYFGLQYLL